MLVPHEPEKDPRVMWVLALCKDIQGTDVLGSVWSTRRRFRDYDGTTFIERFSIFDHAPLSTKVANALFEKIDAAATKLLAAFGRENSRVPGSANAIDSPSETASPSATGRRASILRRIGQMTLNLVGRPLRSLQMLFRFLWAWSAYAIIMGAIYRRARSISILPRVCICHDIYALIPGVLLKQLIGCRVIYDSHELWSEDDLFVQGPMKRLVRMIERPFIRRADAVVTVTPQIARHLERAYGLSKVIVAPNAEPFKSAIIPSCRRPVAQPVRFLLQGGAAKGRGIETLLAAWRCLRDERAQLYLRCVGEPFLADLARDFSDLIEAKQLVMLQPVSEEQLIEAATFADVGIIPYSGPNLNHVYACPNKLSQYMHAGLAVLSNRLEFVSEVVNGYQCGLIYDSDRSESLLTAVRNLLDRPDELQRMKENAYQAARTSFNWEVASQSYRGAILGFVSSERRA